MKCIEHVTIPLINADHFEPPGPLPPPSNTEKGHCGGAIRASDTAAIVSALILRYGRDLRSVRRPNVFGPRSGTGVSVKKYLVRGNDCMQPQQFGMAPLSLADAACGMVNGSYPAGSCLRGPAMARLLATPSIDEQDYFGLAQLTIDAIQEEIRRLGYEATIENNFDDLREHLINEGAVINPSFDPSEHDLADAFWLRIEDENGSTVACHAERVYETDDFVAEYIDAGRLWWHRSAVASPSTWRDQVTAPPVRLCGRVAYAGSMLIAQAHRGRGLSLFLPYLSRALCFRNYGTNFHTGIVRERLAGSSVPTSNYGFPRTTPIFNGTLPGLNGPFERVHLCWMNRSEGLSQFRKLPNHPKFPVSIDSWSESAIADSPPLLNALAA